MNAESISASTVPSDILSVIFEHTLLLTHRGYRCKAIIDLASVCHSWRVTCIDAPNLWSQIVHLYRSYDLICLFLQRSRSHPLLIDYYENGVDERILPLLAQESERWLEVYLVIPPAFYPLLSSIRGRLPLLRMLKLGHVSRSWQNDIGTSINHFAGFEIAPALSHFSFDSPYLKGLFPLPWIQLTYLRCAKIHASQLYSVLLSMPHLSELCLARVFNDSIDETVIPDGHIFRLTSLEVTDCDFQILHSLLRRIPNIEELTILIWERVKMCDYHRPVDLPVLSSLHIQTNRYLPNIAQSFKIHAPMLFKLEFACYKAIYDDDDGDDDEDDDEDDGGNEDSDEEGNEDGDEEGNEEGNEDGNEEGDEELAPVWWFRGGSHMLGFLKELIKDASCVLTCLNLELEVDFDSDVMESLLRVVPHLEHLDIELLQRGGYKDLPLQAMTPACSTLPQLRTLCFRIPGTDITIDEVNQLLAFVSGSTDLDVKFYRN
ncbi:hypothetical protein C8R42DRAFT_724665 [Lentinula raphanica]|nr:hypothetical protein C8R42DRAFT_724665 [Lentinula raphanica]